MRPTVIALLLLLSGAAAALAQPTPVKPNQTRQAAAKPEAARQSPQSGRCDVGVISHLGEKFNVRQIGFTVFGNESNEVSIESWRIDDLVVAKISGFLNKRATVRCIPYPKDAFAALDTPKLFRNYEAGFGEIVRTVTAGTRCARYVVVPRANETFSTTNQTLGGMGIVYAGVGPLSAVNLYALFSLRVYDGKTLTLLTRKAASDEQSNFLEVIRGPHRRVDNEALTGRFQRVRPV